MIQGFDRIMHTPVRECPFLVEGVLGENTLGILDTAWFTVEPTNDDWFDLTDVNTGEVMRSRGDAEVWWLKPEDVRNPAIQAEIRAELAQMGFEF